MYLYTDTCIHTNIDTDIIYIHIFPLAQFTERNIDNSLAIRTPRADTLISKNHSPLKGVRNNWRKD